MTPTPPVSLPLVPQDAGIEKVRPVELFLDLVFVFTISQITGLVAHPHGLTSYLQAALVFASLMWIYDGFAWLTSNITFSRDFESWLMFAAMVGFFLMAVAIPTVAGRGGVLFAAGLLLVTLIHALMFTFTSTSSARAIYSVAPYNFASALLVLAAGVVPHPWNLVLWTLGIGLLVGAVLSRSEVQFSLSPRHFAERNGLLILIALGESIFGLGLGATGLHLSPTLILYVVLGLLLSAHLWWSYFGPDAERVEHVMVSASPTRRGHLALYGFGAGHFLMLSGIILTAAALEVGIHAPTHAVSTATAWNLSGGLALYFVGDVYFRRVMGLGPGRLRLLLAFLLLATVPLGLTFSALAQLLVVVLILVLVFAIEDYVLEPKRTPPASRPSDSPLP